MLIQFFLGIVLVYWGNSAAVSGDLIIEPITYGHEQTVPLVAQQSFQVVDWDGDGLKDVIVLVCRLYTGGAAELRLCRNIGTPDAPLFTELNQSSLLLKHPQLGAFFAVLNDQQNNKAVVTVPPGKKTLCILRPHQQGSVTKWTAEDIVDKNGEPLSVPNDAHGGMVTVGTGDLDHDGKVDVLLGINHASRMKHAFGTSLKTHAPNAARVYFLQNTSSDQALSFGQPHEVTSDGRPLECYGWVYPTCADLDADGRQELILGEHYPRVRVFRNTGDSGNLQLVSAGQLTDEDGAPIATSLVAQLAFADLLGNSRPQMVAGTYFGTSGWLWLYSQNGHRNMLRGWVNLGPLPAKGSSDSPLVGPGISTPDPVDWNGDGAIDLLLGGEPGAPMIAINRGTNQQKQFAVPERLRFIDGTPLEIYSIEMGDGSHHGAWEWYDDRSTPRAVDWDGDGTLDIVSGTQARRLYWMRGQKINGELRFERPVLFHFNGPPILHPHRCLPGVADWNSDGHPDLVGLQPNGAVAVFLGDGTNRIQEIIPLKTTDGSPVRTSLRLPFPENFNHTQSGRSGIAVVDWDRDGHLDLITAKHRYDGRMLFYRNTGNDTFEPARILYDGLYNHLPGPSVVDWDGDGYLDILFGGDFRRICGYCGDLPKEIKAHHFVIRGDSLPVPPARAK